MNGSIFLHHLPLWVLCLSLPVTTHWDGWIFAILHTVKTLDTDAAHRVSPLLIFPLIPDIQKQ